MLLIYNERNAVFATKRVIVGPDPAILSATPELIYYESNAILGCLG